MATPKPAATQDLTFDNLIENAGLSLCELAAKVGITTRSLTRIRLHGAVPRIKTVAALAKALGVSTRVVREMLTNVLSQR